MCCYIKPCLGLWYIFLMRIKSNMHRSGHHQLDNLPGVGVTHSFTSIWLFSLFFQNYQNTGCLLNITFISDCCHCSLAAVTPVKYECHSQDITWSFAFNKMREINEGSFGDPHPNGINGATIIVSRGLHVQITVMHRGVNASARPGLADVKMKEMIGLSGGDTWLNYMPSFCKCTCKMFTCTCCSEVVTPIWIRNDISDINKQRVLMHRHQGWNVRHGLCHIYMRYIYIWVVYSFCLFCCLFIIVTWWYIWCIVWQVASKRKYRHVW